MGGLCLDGGLFADGVSAQMGISVQMEGLCPDGLSCLCADGGSLSRWGSLSRGGVSVQEVRSLSRRSLSGGLCLGVSVQGGLCRGGTLCHGDSPEGDSPHMIMSGCYASYWKAFLLKMQKGHHS